MRNTAPLRQTTDAGQSPGDRPEREERATARPTQERHRLGPEQAAVQMVLFFDYECPQCQRVEQDVRALMKRFPGGFSLSLRHFPQSTDCNHTLQLNTHPIACQAARAAEAAGIMKGEAGFWEMHAWLFERMGRFSGDELRDALPTMGYDDVDGFLATMNGEKPLENILRDVLDAATLPNVGLGTMVMNGIQLESGEIEDALAQAVRFLEGQPPTDALAASPDGSSPQGPFSVELLATAMAATVQIVNVSNGDQGSGVMIAKSGSTVYVLTADHLLPKDRLSADRGERLEIRRFSTIAANGPAVYRSVQVVARAPDDDVAVLRFSTRRDVPAPLSICPPPQIPDDEPFPVLSIGWGGGVPTSVAGRVSATKRVRKRSKGAATLVWELNKPSKPGQSGGPLIDTHGYVVGVASGNSGGHGYFCHTEVIHRLLDQNGLKWLYAEK
ncbi:MAG TPA: trypsin-like peptidase domain-containing protein [Pirellulales bacterium]|nr:trypsin-like peptidase domain-containing protein [Pirellulales bacterium]